jgi:hypothetical protein
MVVVVLSIMLDNLVSSKERHGLLETGAFAPAMLCRRGNRHKRRLEPVFRFLLASK